MVKPEDLEDPRDVEDIKADVTEECGKYGAVLNVQIPGKSQAGAGNVYVSFSNTGDAMQAQAVMNGRLFDGSQIVATYYDPSQLSAGIFA